MIDLAYHITDRSFARLKAVDRVQLLEPASYLGSTQSMIDAVLANHQALRGQA
jgi:hypothetical protein